MTVPPLRFPDFRVDRASVHRLSDQVYSGLRTAIDSGFYKPDDRLPPRDRIAAHYGVSETVVRAAVRRLIAENFLQSRSRIGCIVKRTPRRKTFEKVLIVLSEQSGSYALNVTEAMIESVLLREGYCAYSVKLTSSRDGDIDLGLFRLALGHRPDFVVFLCSELHREKLRATAERYGAPYLVVGGKNSGRRGGIADIGSHSVGPLEDVLKACRRARIRNVCQVDFGSNSPYLNIWNRLRSSNMFIERLSVDLGPVYANLEGIQRAAAAAMQKRIDSGPLPDLLFFVDDYLTMGALPVLLENGVRIPEDVRIVTFANKGFGPVFSKTFARISHDPRKSGRAIAESLVVWFKTGVFPRVSSSSDFVYIPGETFPS